MLAACAVVASVLVGSAQTPPPGGTPRLVVLVSIDQMRFDYLDRFAPLYVGGLKTLNERGAVFTNAKYRHASTETGPGHSVLLTGSHPSHSGIVANEWWDPFFKKVINVVDDPVQTPLGGTGRAASPANLLTFTVGDVLKATNPRTRVVGVSAKDRSAILMAGRRGDAAYWFENDGGNFITSTYYMDAPPAWLGEWNRRRSVDRFATGRWDRLVSDTALYDTYGGKDAVEGERDRKDITFPHLFTAKPPDSQYYVELRRTPFVDEVVYDFALEAMKQHHLGSDADTDILAVGFSGTDYIGHQWGPDSHELMDQMLRVDRLLGRLFDHIDATVGLPNTLIVLSSDHGSRPLVEIEQSRGIAARRVPPMEIQQALNAALAARFPGVPDLISHFAIDVYLNEDAVRREKLDWKQVESTAVNALMSTGMVERVYTRDDLQNGSAATDPYFDLFRNAFFAPRSPHLAVLLKRDIYVNASAGGTSHGSAYDYDRHVPVIFMTPSVRAARYSAPSGPEDIAPTLAHLLKVIMPVEHDARVLTEMIRH